jgi:hypothetical protein
MGSERFPVRQQIIAGVPQERLWPEVLAQSLGQAAQPRQRAGKVLGAQVGPLGLFDRSGPLIPFPPTLVERADQLQDHAHGLGRFGLSFK